MELKHADLLSTLDYDPATGLFRRKVAQHRRDVGAVAGYLLPSGYVRVSLFHRTYRAHRLAWFYVHGTWPADQLDHIDGNKVNNAIANLREATSSQNAQNQCDGRPNTASNLLGVSWITERKKWRAQIVVNGKVFYLGRFATEQAAHAAYLAAKKDLHPFAARMFNQPEHD